MYRQKILIIIGLVLAVAVLSWGVAPGWAVTPMPNPGGVPDYFATPNWANSPPLRKFVDGLPGLTSAATNSIGQYIPVANPDTATYPGSDYYEIGLRDYSEKMHSDLPPTKLRGYYQINSGTVGGTDHTNHYLGPLISASTGTPVRIKFVNELDSAGKLFVPVDTTVMGSGQYEINYDPETKQPITQKTGMFSENRATLHLHGGRTPWISDGTPHQWITPAGDASGYSKGVSVSYVPDMWFDAAGATIPGCAGQTSCATPGATNNPGPGAQTFYYTNDQSARLMFYHDHAWGITRLNVYVGEAAGYLLTDPTEQALAALLPAVQIPLVIQDKTFVNEATITATDPTWNWGTVPGSAVTGDLWWPHVYMPAQNPYNPNFSGINDFGRWHYGPWFFPATPVCGTSPGAVKPMCIETGPVLNPLYSAACLPSAANGFFCQPPEMPGTPNPSWGAEAFLDTMIVNGTAYPTVTVAPQEYRFRVLNAAHDRFLNLQLYRAISAVQLSLTNGGSGYTGAPTVTLTGGGGTGAAAQATISGGGGVTGAVVVSGGSGYTTAAVAITGDGAGAAGVATIDAGIVTGLTLSTGGSGYVTAPSVSFTGGGTGASAAATVTSGVITSITVTSGGSGYDGTTTVSITGTGTGATATATITGGVITAINVTNGGSLYTAATVSITGIGTGAEATATVDPGIVTGLTLLSGGSGYVTAPTVGLVGGGGTGATATASVTNGVITGISITNSGGGYLTAAISITGPGSGASATATVTPGVGIVTAVKVTSGGTGYTSAPTVGITGGGGAGATAVATINMTEVAMVPASLRYDCSATVTTECVCTQTNAPAGCFPPTWPTDGREGGVPDPAFRGPAFIQIGTEGGFLPKPVVLNNQPVQWNTDPTMFNVGNVLQQNEGGGMLILGPAERADIIVDFSQFAGQTLILYNDAPTAFPALDPHYDYYTGAPDRTDIGGYTAIPAGYGPNIRTVMQIVVSGSAGTATPDAYNPATLATLMSAFTSTTGVFATGQSPVIVGQSAYNANYERTFPYTYPYWGVSMISSNAMSFMKPDGTLVSNYPILPKAVHDEMGETFDDFGRMSAKLGLEVPFTNAAIASFVLQNYVDPPTEIVNGEKVQIWKITHNGVDTHPIHFHLFEVQLINRVGWDGFIRLPDDNELGWKDTVRMAPLEDTIVALRPVTPKVPFALPNSIRPLNPEAPLGSTMGFSQIDTKTGGALTPLTTNQMHNFGLEYVWHCHILSHEENDMMRSIVLNPNAVSDILWRNTANGETAVWNMDGTAMTSSAYVTPPLYDLNWVVVGRGDFNGDGMADILWRNSASGEMAVWYMNGAAMTGSAFVNPPLYDMNWQVVGADDFNLDGKADIVWRNTVSGENAVWYMNGATMTGSAFLPPHYDLNWKIAGTGEFNNDGKPDLLWRNTATGENAVWHMNGTTIAGSAFFTPLVDQSWQIVGTGDFSKDVNMDVLWRNSTTGETMVWFMNGVTQIGTGSITPALTDLNWKIVGR